MIYRYSSIKAEELKPGDRFDTGWSRSGTVITHIHHDSFGDVEIFAGLESLGSYGDYELVPVVLTND